MILEVILREKITQLMCSVLPIRYAVPQMLIDVGFPLSHPTD